MGTEEVSRKYSLSERDNKKEIQDFYSKPSVLKYGRGKKKAKLFTKKKKKEKRKRSETVI